MKRFVILLFVLMVGFSLVPTVAVVVAEPKPEPDALTLVAKRGQLGILTVRFDFDKSNIKASEQIVIDYAAQYILNSPDPKTVVSEGHCDIRGSENYNMALGMRRAVSVKNALVSKGIDPALIRTISYGESYDIFDTHWGDNKRVRIIIE